MDLFDSNAKSVDVGGRIRELREARNLSIRALARKSGISANALSMIERGRSSPSVSTLYKLSGAIEVPITCLFREEPSGSNVVFRKANERTRVSFPRGLWEGLGGEGFSGHVEPFMMTLESGANSGPFSIVHSGHEFVMCLRGQLEYQVENQAYRLEPGDTLLFSADLQHRWRNSGNMVTNVVIVLSGFEPEEAPGDVHYITDAPDDHETPVSET